VKAGLDTSVVVRLLVGEPAAQAKAARRLLDTAGPAAVSDLVVGEAYFALRHHYRVPHAEALRALRALLGDAWIETAGVAREVLTTAPDADSPPGFMDRLIHGDYRRDGVPVMTFDRAAARLPGARLVSTAG
jgi:predicted nucleic acid-binding protein